jgi:hypothetical protein
MPAPALSESDRLLLAAGGRYRAAIAASLWPEFPAVLSDVAARPQRLRRVPGPWAEQVVACLPADVASAAASADGRRLAARAFARFHDGVVAADGTGPSAWAELFGVDGTARGPRLRGADLVAAFHAAASAPSLPGAAVVALLAEGLRAPDAQPYGPLLVAFTRLWERHDWDVRAHRLHLARACPSWLAVCVLVARRCWNRYDRALFYTLVGRELNEGFHRPAPAPAGPAANDQLLPSDSSWQVVAAGAPRLDVTSLKVLASQAAADGFEDADFAWPLIQAAAGHPPDFDQMSFTLWAEHTGAALLWLSQAHGGGPVAAFDAHQRFLRAAEERGAMVEVPANLACMRAMFSLLSPFPDVRASLALHCTADVGLQMWFDLASPGEAARWFELSASLGGLCVGMLEELALVDSAALDIPLAEALRTTPGVVAALRRPTVLAFARRVVALLGADLGEDPDRWRTALEVADSDTTMVQVVGAVAAVYGTPPSSLAPA